jgi:hypothetical protein
MNADSESRDLYAVIRSICEGHRDLPSLNPVWLATEAMTVIGFDRDIHELGWRGCHLQFRQIARSFCRRHFDPTERTEDDLFPETLQERYPRREFNPSGEAEYVLRDLLTPSDIAYNVERLRREASAKLKHADALEARAAIRLAEFSPMRA